MRKLMNYDRECLEQCKDIEPVYQWHECYHKCVAKKKLRRMISK